MEQQIRFCTAADGVQIAYATVGQGLPLVKAANWLNHLEFDWQSPIWRHLLEELARDHLLVRYDERGNGLSDWEVADLSFETFVRDLEAVVDAAGLDRFALFGVSQGAGVSIAYAVRNPNRVTHLVLYGGYAEGWRMRATAEERARREAFMTLAQHGWGQDNPAYRQLFTSLYVPDATSEQAQWFNDLQRVTTSPRNAVRLMQAFADIDVRPLLGQVRTPTLVLHCRDEAVVPFEVGRRLAAGIPGARFVPLEGRNHLLLEHEPAWPRFLDELRRFLGTDRGAAAREAAGVSAVRIRAGDRLGRYEVVGSLGAGGMGEVFRARDPRLERDVAIKVLAAGAGGGSSGEATLLREARHASALNHPNVCVIHEVGEHARRPFIVMEHVDGEPLAARIPPGGLGLTELEAYARQLAAAVAHAHARGIVHRDLKSGNVLVTREGLVKVLDFGLARRMPRGEAAEITRSLEDGGTVAGTLAYMAPEVLGGGPGDERSDVWALGVILYEMAGGALPFTGRTPFELCAAILHAPAPEPPRRLPEGWRAIVARALAKSPDARFPDARALHSALAELTV